MFVLLGWLALTLLRSYGNFPPAFSDGGRSQVPFRAFQARAGTGVEPLTLRKLAVWLSHNTIAANEPEVVRGK